MSPCAYLHHHHYHIRVTYLCPSHQQTLEGKANILLLFVSTVLKTVHGIENTHNKHLWNQTVSIMVLSQTENLVESLGIPWLHSTFFFFFGLYWICYNIASVLCFVLFLFLFFGHEACGSPTRGWTHISCIGRWSLNHWTTREVPWTLFFIAWDHLPKFSARTTLAFVPTILSSMSYIHTTWFLLYKSWLGFGQYGLMLLNPPLVSVSKGHQYTWLWRLLVYNECVQYGPLHKCLGSCRYSGTPKWRTIRQPKHKPSCQCRCYIPGPRSEPGVELMLSKYLLNKWVLLDKWI